MLEFADMLGCTGFIRADKSFNFFIGGAYLSGLTAYRTDRRYFKISRSCLVLQNLWDYHIRLENCQRIAYAETKLLHYAEIVDRSS